MVESKDIRLQNGQFMLDEKPLFILSGEIHYFRSPYKIWKTYLKKAKEAGLNTVSTYIPWRWHEYKEGKFDFTGKTKRERDLLSFLKMAESEGLYLFLRPGPVCHGEIVDDGLPGWLIDKYPQIRMKDPDGSYIGRNFISFPSPVYRKLVSIWYSEIMPVIESRQVTKGGNVIMIQLDNEISMINWITKQIDYSEAAKNGYRDFLKERYADIKNLNDHYKTKYRDFSEIEPRVYNENSFPDATYWDWADYWREYFSDYFKFLAGTARSLGIEVPLVANIAHYIDYYVYGRGICSPMTSSMFKRFPEKVNNMVMGGAYQMRRLDYENFHDVAVTSEVVKMISDKNSPVICAELQTGIMFDKPVLYPSDVDLNIFTSCANGLNGLNCYMFASGKNPHGMGGLGTYHDWQAPVSLDGSTKPHYEPIKKWGGVFKIFGSELASSKKINSVTVGFYMPYYMTEYLKGKFETDVEAKRNQLFFDGVCRLLELGGHNFKMVNIREETLENKGPLIVFSLDFMDEDTQRKIYEFIKGGGSLIIGPDIPVKDLQGGKCSYLADKLGLKPAPSSERFFTRGGDKMLSALSLKTFEKIGGNAIFRTEKGNICALSQKHGKGTVIAYSFGLTHIYDYHIDVMDIFLKDAGVNPLIESTNRKIQTALRKGAGAAFLFVANYHQLDEEVSLCVKDIKGKEIKIPEKGSFIIPSRTCRILPLGFPVTENIRIIKTTTQILDVIREKKHVKLKLGVTPCANEEICLEIKNFKYMLIDGKKAKPFRKCGYYFCAVKSETPSIIVELSIGS